MSELKSTLDSLLDETESLLQEIEDYNRYQNFDDGYEYVLEYRRQKLIQKLDRFFRIDKGNLRIVK